MIFEIDIKICVYILQSQYSTLQLKTSNINSFNFKEVSPFFLPRVFTVEMKQTIPDLARTWVY